MKFNNWVAEKELGHYRCQILNYDFSCPHYLNLILNNFLCTRKFTTLNDSMEVSEKHILIKRNVRNSMFDFKLSFLGNYLTKNGYHNTRELP